MSEKDLNQRFVTAQRMRMVAESWGLKGENLGRYMRRHGISSYELSSWGDQMKAGLDLNKPFSRQERTQYQKKIKKLEKQLKRAELLLEFQKKAKELRLISGAESTVRKSAKSSKISSSAGKKKA